MKLLLLLLMAFGIISQADNGIKNVSKHRLGEKTGLHMNERISGIWKLKEDTNSHNYFVLQNDDAEKDFVITYMNRGGDNRGLEHGTLYFLDLNGSKYMACSNWNWQHSGWIFLKVSQVGKFDITAQLVVDTNIHKMKSSEELRAHFVKNANNPAFVGDTLHFRKKFTFNDWR